MSWYEHARAYAEAKWDHLAPVSRRAVAESLVTVTVALCARMWVYDRRNPRSAGNDSPPGEVMRPDPGGSA